MPENTYFRQPETQNMLLDILFIYTKLNPDVGYRQGMHELLAPVLWVVERDAIAPDDAGPTLHQALDARYVEHDTFTLFAEIMKSAKSFYDPAGVGTQNPATDGQRRVQTESAMLVRSRRIFSSLLPQYDPGLAAHLEELDISPQLFLMYGPILKLSLFIY
jgi:TBC1 domain family protein 5